MKLPKELTTVTSTSKFLAMFLFLSIPFVGFFIGIRYGQFTQYLESRADVEQYILRNQPTATQSASTANWKTYKNDDFRFEMRYPNNFFSKLYSPDNNKEEVLRIDFVENNWKDQGVHNPALQIAVIRTNLSPREWLDKNYDPLPQGYNEAPAEHYQNVQDTSLNGIPALKFNLLFTSGSNLSIVIKKEPDLLYYFGAHSSSLGTFPAELFDQILSTFRFTE